jgi:hypothetical protein
MTRLRTIMLEQYDRIAWDNEAVLAIVAVLSMAAALEVIAWL